MEKIRSLFNKSLVSLSSHEIFAFAVVFFLIDHTGLYFGYDNQWMRIFRACAFVWFIPAGYNSGQKGGVNLWLCMAMLAYTDKVIGQNFFPLSALATILMIKYTVDPVMNIAKRSNNMFWLTNAFLLVLFPLTDRWMEYGTMALMMGMQGWLLRHQHDPAVKAVVNLKIYFAFVAAFFLFAEQMVFHFNALQLAFVILSTAWVSCVMYNFKILIMNSLHRRSSDLISGFCHFLAHKTLEIYTASYVILKGLIAYALK